MTLLHKASLALVALAAFSQAGAAHATGVIDVTPTVTGGPGAFTYSYDVSPTFVFVNGKQTPFSVKQLDFTFSDTNVAFQSATGPLDTVLATAPGSFDAYNAQGNTLDSGKTETFVFTSPDAPQGGLLNVAGTGRKGDGGALPVTGPGPSPVPEASTTAGFSLMLALGGLTLAARRKKRTA